jgi:Flp pilus assembly protein TadG
MLRLVCLLKNRRGVAAIEFAVIAPVMIGIILPIADITLVVLTKIEAYQAIRGAAATLRLNPPQDLANFSKIVTVGRYNFQVTALCNSAPCTESNVSAFPKSFSLVGSVSPPAVVFYNHCGSGCNIWHSERLQ